MAALFVITAFYTILGISSAACNANTLSSALICNRQNIASGQSITYSCSECGTSSPCTEIAMQSTAEYDETSTLADPNSNNCNGGETLYTCQWTIHCDITPTPS